MQLMQMAPPDDQIVNQSKLCHLVANFGTNVSGAIWWSNLQVAPSGGQIGKWHHLVVKFATNVSGAMLLPNLVQVNFLVRRASGNV